MKQHSASWALVLCLALQFLLVVLPVKTVAQTNSITVVEVAGVEQAARVSQSERLATDGRPNGVDSGLAKSETVVITPQHKPQTVNAMLSRLTDMQARELLLEHLHDRVKPLPDATQSGGLLHLADQSLAAIAEYQWQVVLALPDVFGGLKLGLRQLIANRSGRQILRSGAELAGALVLALLVEIVVRWCVGRLGRQRAHAQGDTLWIKVRTLTTRFLLDVAGLVAFAVTARLMLSRLVANDTDRMLSVMFVASVIVTVRLLAAISRFLVAPQRRDLRLVVLDDRWARFFHLQTVGIASLLGVLYFLLPALKVLGVPIQQLSFASWLQLAVYLWVAWAIWYGRKSITRMLIGADTTISAIGLNFARWWPMVTLGLIFLNWLLIEAIIATGNIHLLRGQERLTLLLIVMAPALDTMIRGLVNHLMPAPVGEGPVAERAAAQTRRSFVRMGRVLLVMLLILLLTKMWRIDLTSLASTGVGAQQAAIAIECIMMLAVGYLVWEFINLKISRRLAHEQSKAGIDPLSNVAGGEGGTGLSRLASVLPLLQKVLQWVVIVMTILLTLSHAGVDTTPLIAGAGIVGFAIGFGAQTLVRDVVSGLFFLLDDAFRVGEFVEVNDTRGAVEKISIRSLQLRHHLGAIHTIPYGEIPKITNNSRDWVITKMKFTVPFDTNINQVKKIFKKIGQDMSVDPLYADIMLQPFKSQGVYAVDDVGIVVRGKFMAKPGMQFTLRKEIYTRIQRQFAAAGIEFARKEVYVKIPGYDEDTPLDREHQAAIAAAAAAASQDVAPDPASSR